MDNLKRVQRLVSAHGKLLEWHKQKISTLNTAVSACELSRERALGKIDSFSGSGLFNAKNISKSLRDLQVQREQLRADVIRAEREQTRLEMIIERLQFKGSQFRLMADEAVMEEGIEDWMSGRSAVS